MKLIVDPKLFALFPTIRVGIVHGVLEPAPSSTSTPNILPDADVSSNADASTEINASASANADAVINAPCPSVNLTKLAALQSSALTKLQSTFASDAKALEADPRIVLWMDTFKKMGVNPRKNKPTHWALASRLLKEGKWPRSIGTVVDVYLVNQMY